MPNSARILNFPSVRRTPLSLVEARALVAKVLDVENSEISLGEDEFLDADFLAALSDGLRKIRDSNPSQVSSQAVSAYLRINASETFGVFDERDYFLGEFAFLAGGAFRLMGKREDATVWLNRSEGHFRHTVDPAAGLAGVAYARVALSFDMGRYDRVVEEIGLVRESFSRLSLRREKAKCFLLEAVAQKQLGQHSIALASLSEAASSLDVTADCSLLSRVFVETGDVYQLQGQRGLAIAFFEKAATLIVADEVSIFGADLKVFIGGAYRDDHRFDVALKAFRSAQQDFCELHLQTRATYLRLLCADVLLRMNRPREAEWEILAALPVIDEQRMVPESLAALGLLRESVRQRRTDADALSQLLRRLEK